MQAVLFGGEGACFGIKIMGVTVDLCTMMWDCSWALGDLGGNLKRVIVWILCAC